MAVIAGLPVRSVTVRRGTPSSCGTLLRDFCKTTQKSVLLLERLRFTPGSPNLLCRLLNLPQKRYGQILHLNRLRNSRNSHSRKLYFYKNKHKNKKPTCYLQSRQKVSLMRQSKGYAFSMTTVVSSAQTIESILSFRACTDLRSFGTARLPLSLKPH